jgi:hypothetical protein
MKRNFILFSVFLAIAATGLRAQGNKSMHKHLKDWNEKDSIAICPVRDLNSEWDDFSPMLVSRDKMYFNSNRRNLPPHEAVLSNNEHVYLTKRQSDSSWSVPVKSYFLNNDDHTTLAGVSNDETTLYLYRTFGEGDIYKSFEQKGYWSVPERMKEPVNSDEQEQSVTVANGIMIISSEREGGKGGHDLYWAKKNSAGDYLNFLPMDIINTEFDEVDVHLGADGKRLFYSCDNPNGIGGYDIYWSVLDSAGKWKKPKMFRAPLNSENNDRWFFDNDTSFLLCSDRPGGKGGEDIYQGCFIVKKRTIIIKPVANKSDTTFVELTIVRRIVISRGDTTVVEIAFDKPNVYRKSDSSTAYFVKVKIPVFMKSDTTHAEITVEKEPVKIKNKDTIRKTPVSTKIDTTHLALKLPVISKSDTAHKEIEIEKTHVILKVDTTKVEPVVIQPYYARVQIGVYNTTVDEFKRYHPSLKSMPIYIDKVKTPGGHIVNKFLVDQKFMTLAEAEECQKEMIEKHRITDAFIAVYNSSDKRVAIYNSENKMFIMLVTGEKPERF